MAKIVLTEGCIVDSLTIDNKDAEKYSIEELKNITNNIINDISNKDYVINIMRDVMQLVGKYQFCYTCEDCGDTVCEYKITTK